MRTKILCLSLLSFYSFSQEIKKNYINFNLGNSTPLFGVNYLRGFGYSENRLNTRHFEVGVGIGIKPWARGIYDTGATPVASHNFNYVFGRKSQFLVLGYNGIFAKEGRLFGDIGNYTPNPNIGFRVERTKFVFNINYNAYFYKNSSMIIKNEDELFEKITTKVITIPGVSFGWKF
jgi:hypothetical protein